MLRSNRACVLVVIAFACVVSGCSKKEIEQRISGRWGPDPAISSSDFNDTLKNQIQVLGYIVQDAGIGKKAADGIPELSAQDWFTVAEWGFNVGRQDCEIYLDNLFRMNREKQRNDSVLAALSTAGIAVLTVTKSMQAVSIVGAAFGMAVGINDAVLQSYLFTEAPGLVANKVKGLQDAYQDSVEKSPSTISNAETAYNVIQNYYRICLPHAIEGALLQAVANTTPTNAPNQSNPQTPPAKIPTQQSSVAPKNATPQLK
jgi:hypothetical protein